MALGENHSGHGLGCRWSYRRNESGRRSGSIGLLRFRSPKNGRAFLLALLSRWLLRRLSVTRGVKLIKLRLPFAFILWGVKAGVGRQEAIQYRRQYPKRRKHPDKQEKIQNFGSGHEWLRRERDLTLSATSAHERVTGDRSVGAP
jgi:hypothetical protein